MSESSPERRRHAAPRPGVRARHRPGRPRGRDRLPGGWPWQGSSHARPAGGPTPLTVAGAVLMLAGVGVAAAAVAGDRPAGDRPQRTFATEGSRPAVQVPGVPPARDRPPADPSSPRPSSPRIVPTELRIPSVGIRTALLSLRVDRAGRLQVPRDPAKAGWYVGSPTPGDVGPSVVAGHVDSTSGPAVFYRLAGLRPGARVEVRRSDGHTAAFRVREVQRYPKARFPTSRVYGPSPDRAIRLITCGGVFDRGGRGYRDNVVVYASALQPVELSAGAPPRGRLGGRERSDPRRKGDSGGDPRRVG